MDGPRNVTELGREAAAHWKARETKQAIASARAALNARAKPALDAYLQLAGYHFHCFQFAEAIAVLSDARPHFPENPTLLKLLGGTMVRAHRYAEAREVLESYHALGRFDADGYDALAAVMAATGDPIRARLFGTMALTLKDKATKNDRGRTKLDLTVDPAGKRKIISFTLFGSNPRYLRGALHNLIAARDCYPDWTCRYYVDSSVDPTLLQVLSDEGAEVVFDERSGDDSRLLLTRRFLVNDDPDVGHFIIRDCDSVVSQREADAVAEWLASGLPFHSMRDWYTHTDVLLAGLWGGIARVFPDMSDRIEAFLDENPVNTNWDQLFLRQRVWPAIRDQVVVHDRLFGSHGARAFPGPAPSGDGHIGQNVHGADKAGQEAILHDYRNRIPALQLGLPLPRIVIRRR